jgi:hypothetical protein
MEPASHLILPPFFLFLPFPPLMHRLSIAQATPMADGLGNFSARVSGGRMHGQW